MSFQMSHKKVLGLIFLNSMKVMQKIIKNFQWDNF
jgi:hypothetical protein